LKYEDIAPSSINAPETAQDEVDEIREKLSLKGERNDDRVIFDEA
jgi:hypothetical protein